MTTLYKFEAIGEAHTPGPAAQRGFQASEGITPRTVRAETIQVCTRADWKAFSRAVRTAANQLVGAGKAGEARFWFRYSGRVYRADVERIRSPRIVIAGRGTVAWHGKPLEFRPTMITAVPRRALIARELEWAARYRANAMRDSLNGGKRAFSIKAARKTLDEARALFSALDKLP